jgi:hypothetical protein
VHVCDLLYFEPDIPSSSVGKVCVCVCVCVYLCILMYSPASVRGVAYSSRHHSGIL